MTSGKFKRLSTPNPHLEARADIVALFMWQARRTASELIALTERDEYTIRRWLNALHQAGVLRIAGRRPHPYNGRNARVYELQAKPFNKPDTPEEDLP